MQCSRSGCPFLRHPNPANNGGTHCCAACKRTGGHGPLCRQISLEEKKKKKKKTTTKATTTTTKATTTTTKATTTTIRVTTAPTTALTTAPTTALTTAPTTALTTAPTTIALPPLPMVERNSDSSNNGSSKTLYVKAGETITVALFAQTILWLSTAYGTLPGIYPGSSCQFTYTFPNNGTIVLNNKNTNDLDSCTATMGTTSVTVRPNNSYSQTAPTIVGSVTMIWQNNVPSGYSSIPKILLDRRDQGGFWEVYGRTSETP